MQLKKGLKPVALAAVTAVVLAAAYLFVFKKEAPPDYIEATGIIEATEVDLTSKISGRIVELCCREGGKVSSGQAAVRLDSAELSARMEQARAEVLGASRSINESRVSLENAKAQTESAGYDAQAAAAEVDRVKALRDEARENLDRAKGLFKDGYIAKKDLDAAQAAFDSTNAMVNGAVSRMNAAQANLRTAQINIKAARARINTQGAQKAQAEAQVKVLQAQLDDTIIKSPIDGIIVYKAFETGELVSPGASIYTVDDLNNVWARVDIEETQLEKIRLGSPVKITPGDWSKSFTGKVIEIGEVGGFATQREVTRGRPDIKTFRVKAGIEGPQGLLKPGMTVKVRIFFFDKENGK